MKKTSNLRTEKHIIKSTNPFFEMLMNFCHRSKNLYNHANYLIRQEFISNGKWIRYAELDKILKADTEYHDYAEMSTAQSAQQILRLIGTGNRSFSLARIGRNTRKSILVSLKCLNILKRTASIFLY